MKQSAPTVGIHAFIFFASTQMGAMGKGCALNSSLITMACHLIFFHRCRRRPRRRPRPRPRPRRQ